MCVCIYIYIYIYTQSYVPSEGPRRASRVLGPVADRDDPVLHPGDQRPEKRPAFDTHMCITHIYIYIYIYIYICADPFCVKHLRRDLMRLLFRITYSLELYPFDIVILGILGTRRSCGPAEARCVHIYRCMCTYAYICVCVYIYIYIYIEISIHHDSQSWARPPPSRAKAGPVVSLDTFRVRIEAPGQIVSLPVVFFCIVLNHVLLSLIILFS